MVQYSQSEKSQSDNYRGHYRTGVYQTDIERTYYDTLKNAFSKLSQYGKKFTISTPPVSTMVKIGVFSISVHNFTSFLRGEDLERNPRFRVSDKSASRF